MAEKKQEAMGIVVMRYCESIRSHYSSAWGNTPQVKCWSKGPVTDLPSGFQVLEFAPTKTRRMWTYATCCMSQPCDESPIELHLFSPIQFELHVELLTIVAHYHRTCVLLGLGHTVNFGRPWMDGSTCEYGLISLPYLDGPAVELCFPLECERVVRCLWLIPITRSERDFKKSAGIEALESKFDQEHFDFVNPTRHCVVSQQ